ncbi:trans-sulfuration enzyme family protein [Litorilituus lipolyticus]|uniref:Aminotransferase class I/II-fold pyridoxal phosphate-dependent enzyme n=1 Tax=Litorilituus lipolyticus TaxID=2491017 RepID=A0A502KXB9_9GAMM|nr:aminotransferase class I/II-fold pyridoxal phosphate-dependent enzyme [Litorilituus lipolyticus]TPH14611.1 aminotransferase class I/II-fold pyridoxal phosphate-dependent enzyme [Litorilituus lipolyticus]
MIKKQHIETGLVFDGDDNSDPYGAVVPPVYQNSLFTFDSWEALEQAFADKENSVIYTRGNNPTVQYTEGKLALLAGGERAKLFSSGMAAVSAGILHFLSQGDHLITVSNIYGPTATLIRNMLVPKMGVEVTYVSGNCLEEIAKAIRPNTRLIYLESPSSVIFSLQDLKQISLLAKEHDIATMIDNTWATPLYQKPLALGIDLEMHSCSKYLGGHSDIIGGVLIGSQSLINNISMKEYELLGAASSPNDASMLLRSLRTLPIRMERHQQSAMRIAEFLDNHEKIAEVFYPGLASFKQALLAGQQMTGFSGLFSFKLKTDNLVLIKNFFNTLKLFQKGVSWGGHESLIYAPAISCSVEQTPEHMKRMGISLSNMRVSIGLENADDLIADLTNALDNI